MTQPTALVVKTSPGTARGCTPATRAHRDPVLRTRAQRRPPGSPDGIPRPRHGRGIRHGAGFATGAGLATGVGCTACTATRAPRHVAEDSTVVSRNRYPLSPAGSHRDLGSANRRSPPAVPCPAANSAPRAASSRIPARRVPARYARPPRRRSSYRCALTASAVSGAPWRAAARSGLPQRAAEAAELRQQRDVRRRRRRACRCPQGRERRIRAAERGCPGSVLVPPSRASRLSVSRSRGLIAAVDRPPSCCSLRQGHQRIVNLIGRKGMLLRLGRSMIRTGRPAANAAMS